MARTHSDGVESARLRGFDARLRVLEDDAFRGFQFQLRGGVEKKIGRRLLTLDAVTIRDGIQQMGDAQPLDDFARIFAG